MRMDDTTSSASASGACGSILRRTGGCASTSLITTALTRRRTQWNPSSLRFASGVYPRTPGSRRRTTSPCVPCERRIPHPQPGYGVAGGSARPHALGAGGTAGRGNGGCRLEQENGTFDHAAKRSFPTPTAAAAHFRVLDDASRGVDWRSTGPRTPMSAVSETWMQSMVPSCSSGGTRCQPWGCLTRATGCTWKISTGALASGKRLDRALRRPGTALHHKGGTAGKHRALKQNIAFHRGMGRFYRRHGSKGHVLMDLAVYAGIGMKLGVSLSRNAMAARTASRTPSV